MRVTHVITRLVVGGAQENTVASVLGLQKKPDMEVNLISGPSLGPEGSLESSFAPSSRPLLILPQLVRPVHPWKDWSALRRLEKIFVRSKPDIVHTHSGKAGVLGRLAAARAGVPIIVHHIHGPSFGPFQGWLANRVFTAAERYAAGVTTHFVCSASAMTRLYLAAGIGRPEMFTRVFSGFRLEPFLNARKNPDLRARLGLPQDSFVIGKIARLAPRKGHDDLLSAFQLLLQRSPRIRLLFVGNGELRSRLEARVHAAGLTGKVIFTGLVPPGEVPNYVGIMDCVAHLSTREALSRALPQALAAGKPVVSYDFDGADEVCFEGETGFLLRMGDVAGVAGRLFQLANDAELCDRLGRRGREFVGRNFPVGKLVDDLYNLYLKLAVEHGLLVK